MTREEATACANRWVRAHFPTVPQVSSTRLFNDELLRLYRVSSGEDPPVEEWKKMYGKWMVSYFCNWDTDALGLPETLHVLVDDMSGDAQRRTA
jgi:hypothetical protein